MARDTGRTVDQVHDDTQRDNFMTPDEAQNYGLIDAVFSMRAPRPSRRTGLGSGKTVSGTVFSSVIAKRSARRAVVGTPAPHAEIDHRGTMGQASREPLDEPRSYPCFDDPDPLVGHSTRRRIRHALWPPRPMEFESPVWTSAVRATFGT